MHHPGEFIYMTKFLKLERERRDKELKGPLYVFYTEYLASLLFEDVENIHNYLGCGRRTFSLEAKSPTPK